MSGCARSEGYYKIDMRDKVKYLPHHKLKNTTTSTEQKKSVSIKGCGFGCGLVNCLLLLLLR